MKNFVSDLFFIAAVLLMVVIMEVLPLDEYQCSYEAVLLSGIFVKLHWWHVEWRNK